MRRERAGWAKARSAVPTMERQQGAKSMSNRWFAVAALLLLFAAPARAGCLYKTFDFHPEKNDGVVVDAIVDAGSSCTHNFAEGPGYKFTGITLEQPEHGKVVKAGVNRASSTGPTRASRARTPICLRYALPRASRRAARRSRSCRR
jgi:hypothetical protein